MRSNTLVQNVFDKMLRQLDSLTPEELRLSNRVLTSAKGGSSQVSYRVWGDGLDIAVFNKLAEKLGAKPTQRLRWYETSLGMGKVCAANALWTKNVGLGSSVILSVQILHSGTIILRMETESTDYSFSKY